MSKGFWLDQENNVRISSNAIRTELSGSLDAYQNLYNEDVLSRNSYEFISNGFKENNIMINNANKSSNSSNNIIINNGSSGIKTNILTKNDNEIAINNGSFNDDSENKIRFDNGVKSIRSFNEYFINNGSLNSSCSNKFVLGTGEHATSYNMTVITKDAETKNIIKADIKEFAGFSKNLTVGNAYVLNVANYVINSVGFSIFNETNLLVHSKNTKVLNLSRYSIDSSEFEIISNNTVINAATTYAFNAPTYVAAYKEKREIPLEDDKIKQPLKPSLVKPFLESTLTGNKIVKGSIIRFIKTQINYIKSLFKLNEEETKNDEKNNEDNKNENENNVIKNTEETTKNQNTEKANEDKN